jgi:hypothetical protein
MQRTPNCSIVLTLAIMFLPFDYCAKPTNLLYRCNDGTQSHRFITLFHAIVKVALYISYKAITMFISLLGLWCIMPLSPILQLYRDGQFYWWRKSEYPENTDLPQVTKTLSHNVVSSIPRLSRIPTRNVSCDRHWLHS